MPVFPATTLLLLLAAPPKPAAMVLDVTGRVEVRSADGRPKRVEVGDLLYPDERLAVPGDGTATLALLVAGVQERIKPGSEATIKPTGCTPPAAVAERKSQKPAVASTMRVVRPAPNDNRKAGVGLRGGPADDLPDSPPAVTPIYGATVASDRPALAWGPVEGTKGYRVKLLSSAGRELWRAEAKEPRLTYPEGQEALQRGYVYHWEVADAEGRPVATSSFSVATESQLKRLAELPTPDTVDDRAELLAAALTYTKLGAFAEALAIYERLVRMAPEVAAYQKALADLSARAGHPDAARAKTEPRQQ